MRLEKARSSASMAGTMRASLKARPALVSETTLERRLPSAKESSTSPFASSDLSAELTVCLEYENSVAMTLCAAWPPETSMA